jgi:hypothetical protein
MNPVPEWEHVVSAACHLQDILPDAVLVGGTSAALYAGHRISLDADHVLTDLRERFDAVLAQLESVAGWQTARVTRPVLILGNLDGIQTGIRQLIRTAPLETQTVHIAQGALTVPTPAEILRIKAVLILRRNATRDYLDFAALSAHLGDAQACAALLNLDALYPQDNGESVLQQLIKQLAAPMPYDLEDIDLKEYRGLSKDWQDWSAVVRWCERMSVALLKRCAEG